MAGEDLRRLAELCGIEARYHDIWGREHLVADDACRALLAAMGVRAEDDAAVAASLRERRQRPWRRTLPPVVVARRSAGPPTLPLRLPASRLGDVWRWTFRAEGGEVRQGEFRPADLEAAGRAEIDGRPRVLVRLRPQLEPPLGYHRFEVAPAEAGDGAQEAGAQGAGAGGATVLIVAPDSCYTPAGIADGGRVWGPAVQLYALRSRRNWGIGDFTDLRELLELAGAQGAGIVGVNPLHALFPGDPGKASPYSPSSRLFRNPLYLDVEAVPDLAECAEAQELVRAPDFRARLLALRETELVDHEAVWAVKLEALELLYRHFRVAHLETGSERGQAFRRWQRERGPDLELFGRHEALAERLRREDPSRWGWPAWPERFRDPRGPAVERFAASERSRIEFWQYLQWQCHLQLQAVGRRSHDLGLHVGLYEDLAVSVDPGGAETWLYQDLYADGARIGAPPDDFNLAGQDWGLPPLVPERLREAAYGPFVDTLRAGMRHAGALRIDHVMGLMRLFWIPPGGRPREGAYARYPFEDLLGILALESRRNRCLVIGEDLGTVPPEVRRALQPLGVLSYRLFYFERDEQGDFRRPPDYPAGALVAVSTHDLPTLEGWWEGRDVALRADLGLVPDEAARERQIVGRAQDRARLLVALRREGLLPPAVEEDPARVPELTDDLVAAVHRFLARTPARVLVYQLEDASGQREQVNLPGTVLEYPNWRRKLPVPLERLRGGRPAAVAAALAAERGSGRSAPAPPGRRRGAPGVPRATYRLQLHSGFGFDAAAALVPYLADLSVSHLYVSPFLMARPGSAHGYDVIDHDRLDPGMGGEEAYARLQEALRRHGMGLVLDLVTNHMGVGSDNEWWLQVLRDGPASPRAGFFDIDWRPLKDELRGRILLPVLEDHYGAVLEGGLLRLELDPERGELWVRYHEHRFPLDPRTYSLVLTHGLERLSDRLDPADAHHQEFRSLAAALAGLPGREQTGPRAVADRQRDEEVLLRRLGRLLAESEPLAAFVAENVAVFNGAAGRPGSFDLLDDLLERQAYRLAFWRTAMDEINYRRFFDINDLAGLRQEDPRVFAATHGLVLRQIAAGELDGLRIDHVDGLYDPAGYLRQLRDCAAGGAGTAGAPERPAGDPATEPEAEPGAEPATAPGVWLVVEKILGGGERLPRDWPVHGTTGYDFGRLVDGLMVDPAGERGLDAAYSRFVGRRADFRELVHRSKQLIMRVALASELNVLALQLNRLSESDRRTRDFTLNKLREALAEVVACFPVYRTYVDAAGAGADDVRHVERAVAEARRRSRAADLTIFDFIRRMLLVDLPADADPGHRGAVVRFAMKFQQYTGPVMAKGLEDTAFYSYNRLLSLNEVGGEPQSFGVTVADFHAANARRRRHWPAAMLATSTHDSKRSEDVRARISVLSEIPGPWREATRRWARLNRPLKRRHGGGLAPSRDDEYGLYQLLLGAWPLPGAEPRELAAFAERLVAAAIKSVREAKAHSSWLNPDPAYEEAIGAFVRALVNGPEGAAFREDFLPLMAQTTRLGLLASLATTLLKLTSPGVPDLYQGCELWRLNLVDPDNRRPVDWQRRRRLLDEVRAHVAVPAGELAARVRQLADSLPDGRARLYLIWRALSLRSRLPDLFRHGDYEPLRAGGERAANLVAFGRSHGGQTVLAVAPRLPAALCGFPPERPAVGERAWRGTWLEGPADASPREYTDVLTGERLRPSVGTGGPVWRAERVLAHFPVALLTTAPPPWEAGP